MRIMICLTMALCLVLSVTMITFPSTVYACSCVEVQPVEDALARSEAVFAGKAIQITEQRHLNRRSKSILFEVTNTWKGGSDSQVIVTTGLGGGDCGYDFEQGKEYLVYAHESPMYGGKHDLVTIICDRTNELMAAQVDLTLLGQGKTPTNQVDLNDGPGSINLYVWIIATVIVGVVSTLVWRKCKVRS